ncbi:MAG: hypothetical protein V5A14_01005 [Desulfohalobiaceae bacterium]
MAPQKTDRCRELAQAVGGIFQNGLVLGEDALHYLDSVAGCEDPAELPAILCDEDHPEQRSLLELVYFPDMTARLQLEPILRYHTFCSEDLSGIAEQTLRIAPRTRLLGESGTLEIETPRTGTELFLSRLHPLRAPDPEIAGLLEDWLSREQALRCRVHLRACREPFSNPARRLLADFIQGLCQEPDFEEGLLHLLGLAPQIPAASEPVTALLSRRFQLESALDRAWQQEKDLASHAVETLLTQRASLLSINREAVRAEMDWLDRILVHVYQVMPTPKSGPEIAVDSDDSNHLFDFFSRFNS